MSLFFKIIKLLKRGCASAFVFGICCLLSFSGFAQNNPIQRASSLRAQPYYLYPLFGISYSSPFLLQTDTTQFVPKYEYRVFSFNTGGFKMQPTAVMNDLILKLPTVVQVDKKLYIQGALLQEVMIGGNIFFVDNNDAVLKNFPADFVDTVKIYDDISDQATGSNFDDDDVSKAIDITPKKEYEKSVFGLIYGGLGNNSLYNMGANINYFNGNRQFSLIQQTNNINNVTFSPYNLAGATGSITSNSFDDRAEDNAQQSMLNFIGGMNDFVVDQDEGINQTNSFGISYFDKVGKLNFYGNYFFNETDNKTQSTASRTYFNSYSDTTSVYSESGNSVTTNLNHRFRGKIYYHIDNKSVLKISPKLYIQKIGGIVTTQGQFIDSAHTITNSNDISSIDVSANKALTVVNYLKSFSKEFRSLTIDFTPSYLEKKGNWTSLSNLTNTNGATNNLNSQTAYIKNNAGLTGDVLYTEPITNNNSLLAGYLVNYSWSGMDKKTNVISANSNLDSLFSGNYNNLYLANSFKLMWQYRTSKWRFNPGLVYQQSILNTENVLFPQQIVEKSYNNLLPMLYIVYTQSNKTNLKINYKTYTQTPTPEQLLNVANMTNPLNLSEGNSNLNPSLNSLFDIRYVHRFVDSSNINLYSGMLFTNNYLATQSYSKNYQFQTDSFSINITKPVNLDNYYNAFLYANYNTRIHAIASDFNANMNGKYYHTPNMNENAVFYSNQASVGIGLSLSSYVSEKIDFLLSSNTNLNQASSTLNSSNKNTYIQQNSFVKANFLLLSALTVSTDVLHQYNYGLSKGFSDQYFLWNASIGYKFLKDKSLEFRFSIHDILNQNENIKHSVTNYYIEDLATNSVQRYFLFSFVYNLQLKNLKFGNE